MPSNLNSIIIEGNLVRNPESKILPSGTTVTTFDIASTRYYKYEDQIVSESNYFQIETWSRLAQTCGEILLKGRGVRVVGRLKQNRWTDADGKKQSRISIVAEHVEFKPVRKPIDDQTAAADAQAIESMEAEYAHMD